MRLVCSIAASRWTERLAVGWVGAAQRLAVDGHRPLPWPLRGGGVVVAVACDQPVAHCGGQGVSVQPAEGAADGGVGGEQEAAALGHAGADTATERGHE